MENEYYRWVFVEPNEYGITHLSYNKIKEEWIYVHASTRTFPSTEKDGVITGLFKFRV